MYNTIDVSVPGLSANLFQTAKGYDRWSLDVGGFYNFHLPLDKALPEAQRIMTDILRRRVERKILSVKRSLSRKVGSRKAREIIIMD